MAGESPLEQTGTAALTTAAGNTAGLWDKSMGAVNTGLGAADVTNNPYLEKAISAATRPLWQQYNQQVIPAITSAAVGHGTTGGSREGVAQGLASQAALQESGDIGSRIDRKSVV